MKGAVRTGRRWKAKHRRPVPVLQSVLPGALHDHVVLNHSPGSVSGEVVGHDFNDHLRLAGSTGRRHDRASRRRTRGAHGDVGCAGGLQA